MINFFTLLVYALLVACATPSIAKSSKVNLEEFLNIPLSKADNLHTKFGKPSSVESDSVDGKEIQFWKYEGEKGASYEFLIDSQTHIVVEKRFFPSQDSKDANLKNLLSIHLNKIHFERIPIKCRHNNELALTNKDNGISILTKEQANSKVTVIAYSTPSLFDFWYSENKQRKCKY